MYVQRLNLPGTDGFLYPRPSAASHSSRETDALGRSISTRITSISCTYCRSTNDIYSTARSPRVNPTGITFLLNVNRRDMRISGLSDIARFPWAINSKAEMKNVCYRYSYWSVKLIQNQKIIESLSLPI